MSDITFYDDQAETVDLFGGGGYALPGLTEVDKEWLIGVPHVITRVTFWVPKQGVGHCSLEAVVGPEPMLERARKRNRIDALDSQGMPYVDPNEAIVYSDGSTGIRRQVVSLLETYGLIKIKSKLPETGKLGESRYDLDWSHWEFKQTGQQGETVVPQFSEMHNGEPFRLKVLNGLQASRGDMHREDGAPTYYLR